jgi:4-azaleucine resistance transporter AzlC
MKTWKQAWVASLPVMVGYIFVGIAFGLLLYSQGFSWVWALASSVIVYAGSMQFVLVSFLSGGASLLTVAITTLTVNSRHLFYGISFIERFKKMGIWKPYMIYSLTDETYSLLCLAQGRGEENPKYYLLVSAFNQLSWIIGSILGALIGTFIPFNSTGIDFAMTALFVVIFIEQTIQAKSNLPGIIGLSSGIICLVIFGPSQFMLPALILAVLVLMGLRKRIEVVA